MRLSLIGCNKERAAENDSYKHFLYKKIINRSNIFAHVVFYYLRGVEKGRSGVHQNLFYQNLRN